MVGKIGGFRRKSPFISETVRVWPMVTMERFIIIIVKSTYIAQIARKLQMRCMNSYTLNKNVFSLFMNVVSVMSGARSAAGRLFHIHEVLGRRNCGRRSLF